MNTRYDKATEVTNAPLVQAFIKCVAVALLLIPVVVAQSEGQCSEYQFDTPFFPGNSCEDIYNKNLQSRDRPGYYWILDGPSRVYCGMGYTGSSCEDIYNNNITTRDKSGYYRITNNQWVYCNMTTIASAFSRNDFISSCAGVGGTWKRIGGFNATAGDNCPSPWVNSSLNGVRSCLPASTAAGCYSVNYPTNGTSYHRVCGRVNGYQERTPDGFYGNSINDFYVDGISITYGNPRQHIWTYGITRTMSLICPCNGGTNIPTFVGSHYYCVFGAGPSLWDGGSCSYPTLPWFSRQLNAATQDDIEVRSCRDEGFSNEAIFITNLELYVQ